MINAGYSTICFGSSFDFLRKFFCYAKLYLISESGIYLETSADFVLKFAFLVLFYWPAKTNSTIDN